MKIISNTHMREAEQKLFTHSSITSLDLMERVIDRIHQSWQHQPEAPLFTHCIVYAGHGNNAGDALGWAAQLGLPTVVRHTGRFSPESQQQVDKLQASGLLLGEDIDSIPWDTARPLLIDGLLGTGSLGPLREPYPQLVAELNSLRQQNPQSYCVAIDCPTGLGSSDPSICVKADVTIAIGAVKEQNLTDSATASVGRMMGIELPELDLSPYALPQKQVCTAKDVKALLPPRPYELYKNQAGHVHIIAGSKGYIGAAQLAAEAALRAGTGLVTLYALPDIYPLLATRVVAEIIVRPIEHYRDIDLSQADCLLLGPGLGKCNSVQQLQLKHIIQTAPCPLVLDADGLNMAARGKWKLPSHSIITPHEGEMRRLVGPKTGSREEWAKEWMQTYHGTLLLKGARTLIINLEGAISYNSTGGPYMANGGQGDCLSGVIAGLIAQGLEPYPAAQAGAYLCGQAGLKAAAQHHMTRAISASQCIEQLQKVLGECYI